MEKLCVAIVREWQLRMLYMSVLTDADEALREEVKHVLNSLQKYGMLACVLPENFACF